MNDLSVIDVVGVATVWITFLSALRITAVSSHGLRPVLHRIRRISRVRKTIRADRRRRFGLSLDTQYANIIIALTTRWSRVLLLGGMTLIGLGLSFGGVGDVVELVARLPDRWNTFDRGMDSPARSRCR